MIANRRSSITSLIAFATLVFIVAPLAASEDPDYRQIPADMLKQIEVGEEAFVNKDLDTLADELAEDYSWYKIDDAGPQQMVSGRDATLELLNMFFTDDSGWQDADVHRLGYLGNMFVQVEVDRFETPEGPKTIRSLNIYEFKDGKRWREWKFYPSE